ncbi:MAG TPA: ABC transporter ATP-binding protein [Pontiella sp.]
MNTPLIRIDRVSIALSGQQILREVSLQAQEGEYISIIGPNGAGKTTLIKCMAGILHDWSGSIWIAERPISAFGSRELARLQSYVPQAEGRSNPLTVEEFVATGRYPHLSAFTTMSADDHAAIDEALKTAGLHPFRKRKMNSLSGGERQMAFIAAALAQQAKILLLDEPSTFLDYRHQANVTRLLHSACRKKGLTVVAVHHDINTAITCSDRIYALKTGSIAFEGGPEEAADPDMLQSVYETDFTATTASSRNLPFIISGGAL